jgi:hypothetical protein
VIHARSGLRPLVYQSPVVHCSHLLTRPQYRSTHRRSMGAKVPAAGVSAYLRKRVDVELCSRSGTLRGW